MPQIWPLNTSTWFRETLTPAPKNATPLSTASKPSEPQGPKHLLPPNHQKTAPLACGYRVLTVAPPSVTLERLPRDTFCLMLSFLTPKKVSQLRTLNKNMRFLSEFFIAEQLQHTYFPKFTAPPRTLTSLKNLAAIFLAMELLYHDRQELLSLTTHVILNRGTNPLSCWQKHAQGFCYGLIKYYRHIYTLCFIQALSVLLMLPCTHYLLEKFVDYQRLPCSPFILTATIVCIGALFLKFFLYIYILLGTKSRRKLLKKFIINPNQAYSRATYADSWFYEKELRLQWALKNLGWHLKQACLSTKQRTQQQFLQGHLPLNPVEEMIIHTVNRSIEGRYLTLLKHLTIETPGLPLSIPERPNQHSPLTSVFRQLRHGNWQTAYIFTLLTAIIDAPTSGYRCQLLDTCCAKAKLPLSLQGYLRCLMLTTYYPATSLRPLAANRTLLHFAIAIDDLLLAKKLLLYGAAKDVNPLPLSHLPRPANFSSLETPRQLLMRLKLSSPPHPLKDHWLSLFSGAETAC